MSNMSNLHIELQECSQQLRDYVFYGEEAIQRVRELHKLTTENNAACGELNCCGEYEEWEQCADCQCEYPCPTIKALDGEQND